MPRTDEDYEELLKVARLVNVLCAAFAGIES